MLAKLTPKRRRPIGQAFGRGQETRAQRGRVPGWRTTNDCTTSKLTRRVSVEAAFVGAIGLIDQSQPQCRSRWRYIRFSIRGLIILVLVIGCGFGWIVHMAPIQRDAVAAIDATRHMSDAG